MDKMTTFEAFLALFCHGFADAGKNLCLIVDVLNDGVGSIG